MSKTARIVLGLVLAAAIGVLIERLIVTDREAILAAAEECCVAIGRGDVDRATQVLHPAALTKHGDPAATRKALAEALKQLPLERVNFLLVSLEVKDGVGTMVADVYLIPEKEKSPTGAGVFRAKLKATWVKDGDAWKVKDAQVDPG